MSVQKSREMRISVLQRNAIMMAEDLGRRAFHGQDIKKRLAEDLRHLRKIARYTARKNDFCAEYAEIFASDVCALYFEEMEILKRRAVMKYCTAAREGDYNRDAGGLIV